MTGNHLLLSLNTLALHDTLEALFPEAYRQLVEEASHRPRAATPRARFTESRLQWERFKELVEDPTSKPAAPITPEPARVERITKVERLSNQEFIGAKVIKRNRVNAIVECKARFSPTGPWHTSQHKVPLHHILATEFYPE
jgi:hypothetical protein